MFLKAIQFFKRVYHNYMRCILFLIFSFLFFQSSAQLTEKIANNAFLVTRMAAKFHVQPRALNNNFSNDVFNTFLKTIDEDRIFLTKQDIIKLEPFRYGLDEQIEQRKKDFFQAILEIYQKRLLQADTMISNICKTSFDFSAPDKLVATLDTSYPASDAEMRIKLYKKIKYHTLSVIVDKGAFSNSVNIDKKHLDSLEVYARNKSEKTYKRMIGIVKDAPGGIEEWLGEAYCDAIATCYDPHSSFFSQTQKENFESEVGNNDFQFGFSTEEDPTGGVIISSLKPGSAAYKSGLLNVGDKLLSLQWEGKDSIDVSDADEEEISAIVEASNHDKITISVRKSDGSIQRVILKKELTDATSDEENRVQSFLLNGTKRVGYILLPAFYSDWQDESSDANGCANDVAREILKLERENIDGLILDIRNNGGGSVEEAVSLAGIFIDAGPVAQIRDREGKVYTLKDANRGAIYTGPLMLLVNGYSASASEILAGTLQDYNRALIVGTPTFGKATTQVVFPLDTTFSFQSMQAMKSADAFAKITIEKLFRVTGSSAQGSGVQPDVTIPDISQASDEREHNEPFALSPETIDANKFFKPYPPINTQPLKDIAAEEIKTDEYFRVLNKYIETYETENKEKDLSLQLKDAIIENTSFDNLIKQYKSAKDEIELNYTIENNGYENQLIQADPEMKLMNDAVRKYLSHDHCLKIAFDMISSLAK